jgi:hypothetical protein
MSVSSEPSGFLSAGGHDVEAQYLSCSLCELTDFRLSMIGRPPISDGLFGGGSRQLGPKDAMTIVWTELQSRLFSLTAS